MWVYKTGLKLYPATDRQTNRQHNYLQIIAKGTPLVISGDQPELGIHVVASLLRADEVQDVLMRHLR